MHCCTITFAPRDDTIRSSVKAGMLSGEGPARRLEIYLPFLTAVIHRNHRPRHIARRREKVSKNHAS
jgi:hypothetical protein